MLIRCTTVDSDGAFRQWASRPGRRGAVLLEVVLALTLLVAAATVITGGLNSSVREVERLRLNVHASNLAFSVLSELQMGLRSLEPAGPEPLAAPFDLWTCQIQSLPLGGLATEGPALYSVEITIRHQSQPVVLRLTQMMPAATLAAAPNPPEETTPPRSGQPGRSGSPPGL